nr:Gfo/Idh/MocA family oxidoreductase [Armatimonadota bacterium]
DVCLPTHLHLEFASKALRAGKPTLCEKPMCRKVSECAQLVEEAEKAGVPFMPAQVVRFFPEFRKAHQLVKEGAVGTPGAVRARRCGRHPKGADLWFANIELSGGVLMDLAVHDFDWIRWTFGEVRHLFSQSLTFTGLTGLDYSLTTLTLKSGALAHVEANWAEPTGFRVGFEISGTEGFIEYDNRQTVTLRTSTETGSIPESPMLPLDDPYYLQLRGFLDAVENNQPPPVSAIDGLRAVAVCDAAIESAKTGRVIRPAVG